MVGILRDDAALSELSLYCGRDYSHLEVWMDALETLLALGRAVLQDAEEITSCRRILPMVHDLRNGLCQEALPAQRWLLGCTLAMGLVGVLLLWVRVLDPSRRNSSLLTMKGPNQGSDDGKSCDDGLDQTLDHVSSNSSD